MGEMGGGADAVEEVLALVLRGVGIGADVYAGSPRKKIPINYTAFQLRYLLYNIIITLYSTHLS